MKGLRGDDFTFDERQSLAVFLVATGQTKQSANVKMDVSKLMDLVYQAVHAVLVDKV